MIHFVKLSLYNTIHLKHGPFLWTTNSITKGLHHPLFIWIQNMKESVHPDHSASDEAS